MTISNHIVDSNKMVSPRKGAAVRLRAGELNFTTMKTLFKFNWETRRDGELHGLFIADMAEVEAALGRRLYFGEVLGKHSNVQGTLDEGECEVVTQDQEFIAKCEELFGSTSTLVGYNPLHHFASSGEEEDDDDE